MEWINIVRFRYVTGFCEEGNGQESITVLVCTNLSSHVSQQRIYRFHHTYLLISSVISFSL
jgi:hypothetical protein